MSTAIETLQRLGACRESIAFVKRNDIVTLSEAWDRCQRGDWLLWLAAKAGVKRETVVFAACQCARTALKHTSDERVLRCIEVTESWCLGGATLEQVREVRRAAADAYAEAYGAAVVEAYADGAEAYAAVAADAAAAAADDGDDDAAAAVYACGAADDAYSAADARKASQLETANLVRANILFLALEEALK